MNVLDLFSGIGGFSLGLQRAGMRTVAFCEIDPYCRKVLAKHWPNVPIYGDIRSLTAETLADDHGGRQPKLEEFNGKQKAWKQTSRRHNTIRRNEIDLICGGFPCQDISVAGKGAGIEGSRSGLWSEYARIIGEVRPRYVIVENVSALLGRGLERVLGDLAALGFDCEWHCIPASAVGAPHRRDRVWIVGNARSAGLQGRFRSGNMELQGAEESLRSTWAASLERCGRSFDWWFTEPDVGRVAHGVPARVDRLRSLGNAIVPQIAEIIGRAIMEMDEKPAPC